MALEEASEKSRLLVLRFGEWGGGRFCGGVVFFLFGLGF